jgi:trehalose synthase
MYKGAAVIGGNAGAIRCQVEDGTNGFLVSSVKEAASRIVQVLRDEKLRRRVGEKAIESGKKYLLPRFHEQYLDLFPCFETCFTLRKK